MKMGNKFITVLLLALLLLVSCVPQAEENTGNDGQEQPANNVESTGEEPDGGKSCPSKVFVDFESQPAGKTFSVGDMFVENDITVSFEPFAWSDGTVVTDGVGTIGTDGDAGGSGNELWLNNITARFIIPCMVQNLTLYYGAHGGNLNIEINGVYNNFVNMMDLDGKTFNGAVAHVNELGGGLGILKIDGEIWSFSFGGQELVLDIFCPEELSCGIVCLDFCLDFESQPLGASFQAFDFFEEYGHTVFFRPFIWSDGTPSPSGFADIQDGGNAGRSGNELWLNNLNAKFVFRCDIDYLKLSFGEYGGNLNIEINGQFVNFENFADIDGMVIGNVEVHVLAGGGGNDQGMVEFIGEINSFMVGGQEFVIDDVCNYAYE